MRASQDSQPSDQPQLGLGRRRRTRSPRRLRRSIAWALSSKVSLEGVGEDGPDADPAVGGSRVPRRGPVVPGSLAGPDDADLGHRAGDAGGELPERGAGRRRGLGVRVPPGFERGGGRAEDDVGAVRRLGPLDGDVAGVVAGELVLLVGRVVLLVDDDEGGAVDGGEDGGARADGDARFARGEPGPGRLRALADRPEWRTSTPTGIGLASEAEARRVTKRPAVCGVRAISGTRTIAPRGLSGFAARARWMRWM
jgi:hypothetical protein